MALIQNDEVDVREVSEAFQGGYPPGTTRKRVLQNPWHAMSLEDPDEPERCPHALVANLNTFHNVGRLVLGVARPDVGVGPSCETVDGRKGPARGGKHG